MRLLKEDLRPIERTKSLAREKKVSGGPVKGVGSALLTKEGKTFTGVSIDLGCGIGFCAEHSAIASITERARKEAKCSQDEKRLKRRE